MHPLRSVVRARSARITTLAAPAAFALALLAGTTAYANVTVTQVSHDIYTDAQAQHNTEVEPDTFVSGSTIVSAFQVGRVFGGGSSNIGWATSTDGGATWTHGYLPGITINDGGLTWSNPVTTATGSNDKGWIVCDDAPASPHYGNCYTEYDITSSGDSIRMRTSTDGGATWGAALAPGGSHTGLGGQPVVAPNGDVVVPYESLAASIRSFRSTSGGASWSSTVLVSSISHHTVAAALRESPLPSAAIDATGTVYVSWADCRFRPGCPGNDIVLAKSTSETTWAAPTRVPIDATSSTVDHFVPGLDVDHSTSGTSARVGLAYYYYPVASCTAATCQLDVGFISSVNGGTSWSAATQVAGPMTLSWLPNTSQGRMFGDYISTSVLASGNAYPVIAVANAPTGSTFDLAMYIPTGGLAVTGGSHTVAAAPVAPATEPVTAPIPLTAH